MSSKTQRALVVEEKGKAVVSTSKVFPTIGPDEVLVNVKAVTLNPTDWKHIDWLLEPGASTGSDFAGNIVEAGANVKDVKVGTSVAGFLRGGFVNKDLGAFQEYIKIRHELVWRKPESLAYEDAASMGGIALATTALALIYRLGLPKPWETSSSTTSNSPLLVWAGSTSVGLFAIALAKLCSPSTPIITTSSPHNFDLVKGRGADVAFDYKDPEVSQKILAWVKEKGYGPITKAFDTISEKGSTDLTAKSMSEGGQIVTLLPTKPGDGSEKYPNDAKITHIMIYTTQKPENEQDFTDIVEWNQNLPSLVEKKGFGNAIPLKIIPGGLEAVPEGLDLLRQNKVSGSKIGYKFY